MSTPPDPEGAGPQAFLQAGLAASQANEPAQALACFERASAAAPAWAMPQFLIGSEYAALGEMDRAEAAIANAVLLDPTLHIARYQLGLLQYSSGRAAAALVTWQPLLAENEPGLPDLVRGFAALAQDQLDQARRHFMAGLATTDLNPSVAGDVRKVLAGLANTGDDASSDPVPAQPGSTPHVLLSAYDKYRLH